MKKLLKKLIVIPFAFVLASCSPSRDGFYSPSSYYDGYYPNRDTNSYTKYDENPFIQTSEKNTSSFSLCSSTAAYTNIKSLINDQNTIPTKNAVKTEQMLNYFKYNYELSNDENLGIFNEVSDCPWNSNHKLASIAVKGKEAPEDNSAKNFVFLIDVSGSMSDDILLMKEAFQLLVNNIGENDKISIVTYANGVNTVLEGCSGDQKERIMDAINSLRTNGSTNGSGGIQRAYEIAEKYKVEGSNNRIILATDGDFNVGISNQGDLSEFISQKRETGIYLSILGFGMRNYHSDTAETLAKNGNGNMFYIDSRYEAMKLFGEGLSSAFTVIAKDVKTLITFDASLVKSYRLIGYENDLLSEEQFYDDTVDAGEILSGDVTVAMYEIELVRNANLESNLFKSELHYKDPETNVNKTCSNLNSVYSETASDNFIFQSLVVEYGLALADSQYKGQSSYDHIINRYLENVDKFDLDRDKNEFYNLVCQTRRITSR